VSSYRKLYSKLKKRERYIIRQLGPEFNRVLIYLCKTGCNKRLISTNARFVSYMNMTTRINKLNDAIYSKKDKNHCC